MYRHIGNTPPYSHKKVAIRPLLHQDKLDKPYHDQICQIDGALTKIQNFMKRSGKSRCFWALLYGTANVAALSLLSSSFCIGWLLINCGSLGFLLAIKLKNVDMDEHPIPPILLTRNPQPITFFESWAYRNVECSKTFHGASAKTRKECYYAEGSFTRKVIFIPDPDLDIDSDTPRVRKRPHKRKSFLANFGCSLGEFHPEKFVKNKMKFLIEAYNLIQSICTLTMLYQCYKLYGNQKPLSPIRDSSQLAQDITIFVVTVNGYTLSLQASLDGTIKDFKVKIQEKSKAAFPFRLIGGTKELRENLTFRDYGLYDGCTIFQLMTLKGGMNDKGKKNVAAGLKKASNHQLDFTFSPLNYESEIHENLLRYFLENLNLFDEALNKIEKAETYKLFVDGSSRSNNKDNPGPAGVGYAFYRQNNDCFYTNSIPIQNTTNNVAEICAILYGLNSASNLGIKKLIVHSDSELIVKQINGNFNVKDDALMSYHQAIKNFTKKFLDVQIKWVPRESNTLADSLAQKASGKNFFEETLTKKRGRPPKNRNNDLQIKETNENCPDTNLTEAEIPVAQGETKRKSAETQPSIIKFLQNNKDKKLDDSRRMEEEAQKEKRNRVVITDISNPFCSEQEENYDLRPLNTALNSPSFNSIQTDGLTKDEYLQLSFNLLASLIATSKMFESIPPTVSSSLQLLPSNLHAITSLRSNMDLIDSNMLYFGNRIHSQSHEIYTMKGINEQVVDKIRELDSSVDKLYAYGSQNLAPWREEISMVVNQIFEGVKGLDTKVSNMYNGCTCLEDRLNSLEHENNILKQENSELREEIENLQKQRHFKLNDKVLPDENLGNQRASVEKVIECFRFDDTLKNLELKISQIHCDLEGKINDLKAKIQERYHSEGDLIQMKNSQKEYKDSFTQIREQIRRENSRKIPLNKGAKVNITGGMNQPSTPLKKKILYVRSDGSSREFFETEEEARKFTPSQKKFRWLNKSKNFQGFQRRGKGEKHLL